MGTPTHAFNGQGDKVWERELDVYGAVRKETGQKGLVPQLYQGQWVDNETGLAYNRFRYYDNESGFYLSQDPIKLAGGLEFYHYVSDNNSELDLYGLSRSMAGKAKARAITKAQSLKKSGSKVTMTSAAVSRKTGRVYYGVSGASPQKISAQMKSQMDFDSKKTWDIDNCAEFDAVNKATLKGEKLSDLDVFTLEVETLNPRVRCDNCKISTEGVHTKSDMHGHH